MYVLDGQYDFTAEDLERVSRFINSPENQEKMRINLVKARAGTLKHERDPEVTRFAQRLAIKAMLGSALMKVDPIQAMAEVFIMGVEHGVAAERMKPESEKFMTLNLGFGNVQGGTA